MITIKHPVDLPDTYPLDRIGPLKDLLFFDIENIWQLWLYSPL